MRKYTYTQYLNYKNNEPIRSMRNSLFLEVYFKVILFDGFGIAGIVNHTIYGVVNSGDEPHFCCFNE